MSGFLKNENREMAKLCDVFIWLGKFNFGNKVVASCAPRRIKRTPSWRSQNERPVKTGARVVLLGHTRHCFAFNIVNKFSQTNEQ